MTSSILSKSFAKKCEFHEEMDDAPYVKKYNSIGRFLISEENIMCSTERVFLSDKDLPLLLAVLYVVKEYK